jgi:hypothetical protein
MLNNDDKITMHVSKKLFHDALSSFEERLVKLKRNFDNQTFSSNVNRRSRLTSLLR